MYGSDREELWGRYWEFKDLNQNGTWDIIFASQSLPEELCSSIIYLMTLIHDMNFCSITTQVFLLYYDSGNFHSLLKKIDPS